MIEGVFFDGDDTLWDFEKLMRRALLATLEHLRHLRPGLASDHLTVDSLIQDRLAAEADAESAGMKLEELRHAAFARTIARIGPPDDDLAATLNAYYVNRRFTDVPLFEDVVPVLTKLRGTMPLGLLTNGNGYPARSGLRDIFTVEVFADDHGIRKPDRRLFEIAAGLAAIPPDRLVMVGDSLTSDVVGAQSAGWRGVWLNRAGRDCGDGVHPDAVLRTLYELPGALASLA